MGRDTRYQTDGKEGPKRCIFAARHGGEVAMTDEISAIVSDHSHFHSVILFSDPSDKCVRGKDYDCEGFLSVDVLSQYLKSSNYEFYICGPPPMMDAIDREVLALRHFEELGNRHVAEILGLEPTAASNRYVRALKRLKDIIADDDGD